MDRHLYSNTQMESQQYNLADFPDMESMQFVNPYEINPIMDNLLVHQSIDVSPQVSLKQDILPKDGSLNVTQNQLKMEEFSDLSVLLSATASNLDLIGSTDELSTPVFDMDGFDFTPYAPVKKTENEGVLKVKVEYNAQYYSSDKNMFTDLSLGTTPEVHKMENSSISKVGNKPSEMYLYQLYAHNNLSFKDKEDGARGRANNDLFPFDSTAAHNETSFDSPLSVNCNIKYSSSNIPSPQDDQYSYISSPAEDQQMDIFTSEDSDHSYDLKPNLNLKIDNHVKIELQSTLNTPDVIEDVVNMGNDFNILDLVNNEDITILSADEELLTSITRPQSTVSTSSTPSTSLSKPPSPAKRPRRRKTSYDNDDDVDYIPPSKKSSTVRLSDIDIENSSSDTDFEVKKLTKKTKCPKPRGRPPKRAESVSSDCSKDFDGSKYRKLRDKNNEASRKSRLKRKSKEQEYEKEADELHMKNIRLKAQVEELDKMVTMFRNNLFKILVNK